ncbi:MAG: CPBP family intramembrane glutamic endopeptidase [Chitinophagales bacterium]|nr:CPBP family intramembrane metalloprotease [Bacteroidota bacterium]
MNNSPFSIKPTKEALFWLSTSTLFGFSLAGILGIAFFSDKPLQVVLFVGDFWWKQVLLGLAWGVLGLVIIASLSRLNYFANALEQYESLFDDIDLNWEDILFYSICAAIGEEVFFRAAVQPHAGIWVTSFAFVALHGYLDPRNFPVFIIGILLFGFSCGLGYLCVQYGLLSSIVAHFVYDFLMFAVLIYLKKKAK